MSNADRLFQAARVRCTVKTFVILGGTDQPVESRDPCILVSIDGGASYIPAYAVRQIEGWPRLTDTVS